VAITNGLRELAGGTMANEDSLGKPLIVLAAALLVAGTVLWWGQKHFPQSPPYMDKLMYGVYLQGNDIESKDAEGANTEEQCSKSCLQDSRCRAMSFIENSPWGGGVCRLKDKVSTRSSAWIAISAVKVFPR
jgi:PAN domain